MVAANVVIGAYVKMAWDEDQEDIKLRRENDIASGKVAKTD